MFDIVGQEVVIGSTCWIPNTRDLVFRPYIVSAFNKDNTLSMTPIIQGDRYRRLPPDKVYLGNHFCDYDLQYQSSDRKYVDIFGNPVNRGDFLIAVVSSESLKFGHVIAMHDKFVLIDPLGESQFPIIKTRSGIIKVSGINAVYLKLKYASNRSCTI